MAYRWVVYNSVLKPQLGDGVILGASKTTQLEDTLKIIEDGPLNEETAKQIDAIWESVKSEAPHDNYHDTRAN